MTFEIAIIKRFAKGFIAGGLASSAALLMAGVSISSIAEFKTFATAFTTAFFAGGLLAIEKMLSWTDGPQA